MEHHGNIDLLGKGMLVAASIQAETNFPSDPQPGRFVFKEDEGVLYFCVEIAGGLPIWVPLTKPRSMVRWTQSVAALEWTIPHDLNMSAVFVQVYDDNGRWVIPDQIITEEINQVTVTFSTPIVGTAVIMRGETEGAAQPLIAFEQAFVNSDTWVVNHGLGYNPNTRIIIGFNEVQPLNIVHNSLNQLTVTFTNPQSGSVRCI